jgi:hypothetical protein
VTEGEPDRWNAAFADHQLEGDEQPHHMNPNLLVDGSIWLAQRLPTTYLPQYKPLLREVQFDRLRGRVADDAQK